MCFVAIAVGRRVDECVILRMVGRVEQPEEVPHMPHHGPLVKRPFVLGG